MAPNQVTAFCIMADVMSSRKESKKVELRSITDQLNDQFGPRMWTDFTIRSGDELFGIVRKFSDGYRVLKQLLLLSDEGNVPLYAGVGLGYLFNEDLRDPNEVNGSAIWSAADALKLLKKEKQGAPKPSSPQKTFRFHVSSSCDFPYDLLNYQIFFLFERLLRRTDKQREIVKAVEYSPNHIAYDEIGERFGYDKYPSINVSKILSRADHPLVSGAEKSLCDLLDYFQDRLGHDTLRGTEP